MTYDNVEDVLEKRFIRVGMLAAWGVIFIGVLIVAGWMFNHFLFQSALILLLASSFDAGILFIFMGLAILHVRGSPYRARLLAIPVAGIALIMFCQYIFHIDLKIDTLIINDALEGAARPGRLSPLAALYLLLSSIALIMLSYRQYALAQMFSNVVFFLSMLAVIGHIYNVEALYRPGSENAVSFISTLALMLTGMALLCVYPTHGTMSILVSGSNAGTLMRWLMPAMMALPIILGWFRLQGHYAGQVDIPMGMALYALTDVLIFTGLTIWLAHKLLRVDAERVKVMEALRQYQAELLQQVAERTASLEETNRQIGREIFERGRVEKEIRDKEHLMHLLMNHLPQNIFVKDTQSRFVMANQAALNSLGVKAESDVIGKTDFDFHDREKAGFFRSEEMSILNTGQSRLDYEEIIYDRGYQDIRVFLTSKMPLRNEQGQITGLVGINHDMTERLEMEDKLRQQDELYRTLINHVPQSAVVLFNHDLRFLLAGGTALADMDYTETDIVGRTLYEVTQRERAKQLEPYYRLTLRGEKQFFEWQALNQRYYMIQSVPLRKENHDIFAGMMIMQDITERKQAEEQRLDLEVQREKVLMFNRFINDASHDLRTPITVMKTSLSLVKRLTADTEKQVIYIQRAEDGLNHIHMLIENLFTLARLDMETGFNVSPQDINTLVEMVGDDCQEAAAQHQHTLIFQPCADLPRVSLDAAEIVIALRNIILNALGYTQAGGKIQVETARQGDFIAIIVRDNGIGIHPDDMSHIFDRFFRADKARGITTGGSGLGLPIASKIIAGHRGQIQVESEPGQGSVFRVLLPVDTGL